jgi:hypothetical protein
LEKGLLPLLALLIRIMTRDVSRDVSRDFRQGARILLTEACHRPSVFQPCRFRFLPLFTGNRPQMVARNFGLADTQGIRGQVAVVTVRMQMQQQGLHIFSKYSF